MAPTLAIIQGLVIHAKPCIVAKVGAVRADYVPSVSNDYILHRSRNVEV